MYLASTQRNSKVWSHILTWGSKMPSCRWKPIRALFQTPGVPCCHAFVSDEGVRWFSMWHGDDTVLVEGFWLGQWCVAYTFASSLRECQESFQHRCSAANSHSSDPEASDAESMRLPGASIFTQLASQEQCLIGKCTDARCHTNSSVLWQPLWGEDAE